MRHYLILALLLATGIFAWAAPFKNIEIRLTQPDGQVVNCYASGDEFYNYLHDVNGFTIVQGDNGYYYYAVKDARGAVAASAYVVGSVDPAAVGLKPNVKISEKAYYARRQEWEKHLQRPEMKNGRELNHGRYNNLVVFIRFAGDTYHTTNFSTVDAMFNAEGWNDNSLYNYYRHTSYNQLDLRSYFYPEPDGETVLSYEDIYPKQYYQPYDPVGNPIGYTDEERAVREFDLLERAIEYIKDMVPEDLELDYNGDGKVDNVVFVCKGETGAWNSLLWPHRWCIYDRVVTLNNLQVFDFNLQLEQGGYFRVSTLCHEMFHSLGGPDLYHYSGGVNPVGSWDLMCSNSEPPQQMSSYMKYKYGNWIDEIPVINPANPEPNGTYELEATSWEGGRRNGYMIATSDPNQYFFIEYRDKSHVFDSEIPGSGLLIYLIDTRFDGNAGWNGNDYLDEVYVFRPGGTPNEVGDLGLAFFSEESGRTSFNVGTDPYPFIHNQPYIVYDWLEQITNISKTGDRMSFDYMGYEGEGGTMGPDHFVAHVNSQQHQVELSWNSNPYAGYYNVYRDGTFLAEVADTTFAHPYTDADNGYHVYSVLSVDAGLMHVYSAESKAWVILGSYETIDVDLTCNSQYGTIGGELEMTFSHPDMKPQHLTIYEGTQAHTQLQVPANTEVTFTWHHGFDSESQGIVARAKKRNESGQSTLFNIGAPEEGVLGTYTAEENHKGLMAPQHLTATTDGQQAWLHWTLPVEADQFKVYRDGMTCGETTSNEYHDEGVLRSGTVVYNVGSINNDAAAVDYDNKALVLMTNPYCEAPVLSGTHQQGHNDLTWTTPEFAGYGMLAYDDSRFVTRFGNSKQKWGIKIMPEQLEIVGGQPLTHLEMFDIAEGVYKYSIYNGETANNNNLLFSQEQEMTASGDWVRFALSEEVNYDASLPLWIKVESPSVNKPVPACDYVGLDNSCLAISGSNWAPVTNYGFNYSWLLRAYTRPQETPSAITYNLYWCPDGASDKWTVLGMESLTANTVVHNTNDDFRYYVTALWDGKETAFSNPVCLGPTVSVEETVEPNDESFAYVSNGNIIIDYNDSNSIIQVIDLTGRIIFFQKGDIHTVSTEGMAPGIYVLRLITGNGIKSQKILCF